MKYNLVEPDIPRLNPRIRRLRLVSRRQQCLLCIFSAIAFIVQAGLASPSRGENALQADSAAIDFGEVRVGGQFERIILLRNCRDTTTQIRTVESDCDCLTGTVDPAEITPGGIASLRIRLETCRGVFGQVRRHVWVRSDRDLRIDVRYEVVPAVRVHAAIQPLGLMGDRPIETHVKLLNEDVQELVITGVDCGRSGVVAEVVQQHASRNQSGLLRFAIQPPAQRGVFSETVRVTTTHPEFPRLRIAFTGEVVRGLTCERRVGEFQDVAFGHSGAETIVFKQSGASRLRGVRSTSEDVAVESIQREGDLVTVKLRTRAGLGLGTFNGHLLLEVDDGDVRTIRFGYRGRVVESAPRNGDRA